MTHHIVKDWRGGGKAIAVASFLLSLFISLSIPQLALAANGDDGSGRIDYDLDDDGLIEINDLADLDEIRNNLDGTSLYSANAGCPADGCNGFELTTDLDFDSNQDGVIDVSDDYWNSGSGWSPIGINSSYPFIGIFEGNGHVINNLTINRPSTYYVGLFGGINNAQIRQLGLSGSLMSVTGYVYVGALVGRVYDNNIINAIYNTGSVEGDLYVGGLLGRIDDGNQINASYNTGSVVGDEQTGGLLGRAKENNQITASYSSGYVSEASYAGGLIGVSSSNTITNSYWAIDSSGQITSHGSSEDTGYVGLTLATLQCATNLSTSDCVSSDGSDEGLNEALTLYKDWGSSGYWDFGTSEQLPGLILNGVVHRDSDGDGSLDANDAFPNERAASLDQDNDGYPDRWASWCDDTCIASSGLMLDQLPFSNAAWQDSDLDGLVDAWAADCDSTCQSDSGLTLDAYLNDTDNDGITNDNDSDDNNDGITNIDLDRNGLIEISTLAQLDAIRYQLDGSGYRAAGDAELNQSGCPFIVYQGSYQQRCSGYELSNGLDFDTNQNGVIDENDEYWNANDEGGGEGWVPLGDYSNSFTGIFEGNGHVISNLYINRPGTDYVSLFGRINNAEIRQLGLSGSLMSVTGDDYVGGLVGFVDDNNIINATYNTGSVTGDDYVGGLAGYVYTNNQITANYNTGSVVGDGSVGGLLGRVKENNQITASYSSGYVSGASSTGGLIGYSYSSTTITNSYWAIDSSGQTTSYSSSEDTGYVGLTLATLQCATDANTSDCVPSDGIAEGLNEALTLYKDWDSSGYWDFGTNLQLPGLILNGVVYRDSDGDGSLDENDDLPNQPVASLDQDGDGYPDSWTLGCDDVCIASSGLIFDQYPTSTAGWQDSDLDGVLDAWAADCDSVCQSDSGLTLDAYLNDTDNDGTTNENDSDDNGDGIPDADADSDGLIEISTLAQLYAIRYQLGGSGYRATSSAELDQSGCPFIVYQGSYQQRCSGYELSNDLDFDTNQDGVMDENDDYWNSGSGWSPIGSTSTPFTGTFEGNGHVINNLTINRPSTDYVGLFGYINGADIRQLGLSGSLMSVTGDDRVGGLAGYVADNNRLTDIYTTGSITGDTYYVGGLAGLVNSNNQIRNAYNTGAVTGSGEYVGGLLGLVGSGNEISAIYNTGAVIGKASVGGLAGYVRDSNSINAIYNSGPVSGSDYVGGLAGRIGSNNQISNGYNTGSAIGSGSYIGGLLGYVDSDSQISNSFSSGFVSGKYSSSVGGLVGTAINSSSIIINSYWATDSSGLSYSSNSTESSGYLGLSLATLQCAITANSEASNSSCVSNDGSAEGLDTALTLYADWQASGYWDFGNSQQLPGLILNGVVHRDSDGDGALDEQDVWPNQHAASLDQDNDGYPDSWVLGCDNTCIAASGLSLDQFPTSAAVGVDADLDGLVDAWAPGCDTTCQNASGFILDAYIDDTDNDGLTNFEDDDDNNDGITDVDADSDGLIEISTLAQLDAMRNQLDGTGYRASSDAELDQSGCPAIVYQGSIQVSCSGFELINDLDFDSNQDGIMDANDTYWSEGQGWSPIGDYSTAFSGVFEGNGHVINNLTINRPSTDYVGLFGYIDGADIRQMGLSGSLMSVMGDDFVGGLAGWVNENNIINAIYSTGSVTGARHVGGLAGRVDTNNQIRNSYNTGSVTGSSSYVGGLLGLINTNNQINNSYNTGSVTGSSAYVGGFTGKVDSSNQITASFSTGYVSGSSYTGGLIGASWFSNTTTAINNSYWAIDSSGQTSSSNSNEGSGYVGLTLSTLQCAVAANSNASNSDCVSSDGSAEGLDAALNLYADWEVSGYWDFGDSQQLPGLILNGTVHRDSDGDGALDENDSFPSQRAASLDQDKDGYPDRWALGCDDTCIVASGLSLDQFPTSAAAGVDTDLDGLVDVWALGCDASCQGSSGLVLDTNLNDTDNDGISNDSDSDDNGDGIADADADSDGLIEISTLAQLDAIRFQLGGTGYRANSDAELDQSGCPSVLYQNSYQQRCFGYELINDLDFDTNQDGAIDANDSYWNEGEGWIPIGDYSKPFVGIFEGSGHVIENLHINRPSTNYVGLFGVMSEADVSQLGLTGPLMSVVGADQVGALAGRASENNILSGISNTGSVSGSSSVGGLVGSIYKNNTIDAIYNTGSVEGSSNYVGGLVGYAYENNTINGAYNVGPVTGLSGYVGGVAGYVRENNTINATYNTGAVTGSSYAGGLLGFSYLSNQINNSFSSGFVSGESSRVGGIIGYANSIVINNSYWATDSSGQASSYRSSESLTLAKLQCAIEANTDSNNSDCVSADGLGEGLSEALTLYQDWDNSDFWDFGDSQQLPGLILNGVVHRDSDGDGVLDENDAFPNQSAASLDQDSDGHPDIWATWCDVSCIEASGLIYDQFPNTAAAGQDSDLDGLVDAWSAGCDDTCQGDSGLTLDAYLDDTDNDGISNANDGDDNGDGIADADADSDGLIEISTLAQLDAIRFQLDGTGYRASSDAELDQSGCPATVYQGITQLGCSGYELSNDLDFDTNQDGVLDSSDDYWNEGEGWVPIPYYSGVFEGNGHVINNLYINLPNAGGVGLFGSINNAEIRQLGLTGPLMSITGEYEVGALVGYADENNIITAIYNTGPVTGIEYLGGLVGYLNEKNQINDSYSTGAITGLYSAGGLVGYVESSNLISASFSTGSVSSEYAGGLVSSSESSEIFNSYWAIDSSGQATSSGSDEDRGYVGLSLSILQCAVAANSDVSNSSCVSSDGSDEGLEAAVTLYADWQASGYWDFGNNQQLPGLLLNGVVHRDSDGDGSLDEYDDFYLNPAASIDDDEDGQPDAWAEHCDTQCQQESGLEIDPSLNDTDNDLVINSEDLDDDNDGLSDLVDAYPLSAIGELTDTDNDGAPNECDEACAELGMAADTDDDNDGVLDTDDPELGADNGAPELIAIADDAYLSVTTENGFNALVTIDDDYMLAFVATDMVDNDLRFEATLNGSVLTKDEDDQVLLPAGNLDIIWVAIDDAGNRSNSLTQNVKVYPRVSFTLVESIIGEASDALIEVELSGKSPVYPVTIELEMDALSDVDQNDLSDSFDISAKHQVMIERGDDESEPNTQVNLVIPVIDDGINENDELLQVNLNGVIVAEDEANFYEVNENLNQHTLTVTYQNLAPVVQLQLKQDGVEVGNVTQDGGVVTVTALITDGNGNDTHTFAWDLNSLGLSVPLGDVLTFSPANLAVGEYSLSVEATDDGINPLSGLAQLQLNVTAPRAIEPDDDAASGDSSGGGGGTLWWMLFVLVGTSLQARRRRNFN